MKEKIAKTEKKTWILAAVCVLCMGGLLFEFLCIFPKYDNQYGPLKIIRYMVLIPSLFYLAEKDQKEKIIPNRVLMTMTGIRLLLLIIEWFVFPRLGLALFISCLIGAAIGGGVFGLCMLLSRGSIGAGDVKLMAVLGIYLGYEGIMLTMLIIVICAGVYCLVGVVTKKLTLKGEIPFAPFILIGTLLSMALGV